MKRFPACLLFIAAFLPPGCMSGHTERASDVNPLGWNPGDTVWVAYHNTDTLSTRDLSVMLRLSTNSGIDTLSVILCTVTPDSVAFSEKISLPVTATGRIRNGHLECTVPYRRGNVLSRSGEYLFGFVPQEKQTGVTAVGIKFD